jgi:hypothetical protein
MARGRDKDKKYEIVDPNELYFGKSYSGLAEDWFNWYVSADADKRNFGPVVFLRTAPIPPNSRASAYSVASEMSVTNTYADDAYYDRPYQNLPNVRVGGEKIVIRKDQAVFIPIIIGYEVMRKPYFDWGQMQELTGLTIDDGDDPPKREQLKIDGFPIEGASLKTDEDMKKFRILTSIFSVVVPEADYGRSIKDFLEVTVSPGVFPAIVEGYFVLLKNFTPGFTYLIHSRASAGREQRGPYVAELVYEISVENRTKPDSVGAVPYRSSRNQAIIKRILTEKMEKGELTQDQRDGILGVIETD